MYGVKNVNYVTVHYKTVPAWKLKVDILNVFFNHQKTMLDSKKLYYYYYYYYYYCVNIATLENVGRLFWRWRSKRRYST